MTVGTIAGMRRSTPLLLGLALAGCFRVGPDYLPPEVDLPARYAAPAPGMAEDGSVTARWWERFDDPLLNEIVHLALAQNLDIAEARSRVREARAVARGTAAGLRPSLDAFGNAGGDLRSDDRRTDAEGSADAGLSFFWDADLFGGIRAARTAAEAEAFRQDALRQATALAVVGEAANIYASLRGAQLRLALTEESLKLQRQTQNLVEQRVAAGLAAGLDRVRAQAAVAALAADVPPVRTEIDRAVNALGVLTGALTDSLAERLATPRPVPVMAAGPGVGVPAELLRRRPDMRAAEFDLVRATAEIGVATAALYPRLTLPGSLAVQATGIGAGSIATAVVGSLTAVLDVPLFDSGARRAEVEVSEERAQQALIAYRRTLLTALQEVESALIGHAGARDRAAALREAVAANQVAADRARSLYTQGLVGFLDVLDAQRELTGSRLALAQAETALALEVVALYRALGAPASLDDFTA